MCSSDLTISLDGLGIGFSLPSAKDKLKIGVDLMGLGVEYKKGKLEVTGGLAHKKTADSEAFIGELLVREKPYVLTAMGMLKFGEYNSFFVFAMLGTPMGGPLEFFVTGLAGGIGMNSQLNLPSIEKLAIFPLVAGALTGTATGKKDEDKPEDINSVLAVLTKESAISSAEGQFWLGIGIRFTTYKLVESFALLTLSMGHQFQLGLLGRSEMRLPPGSTKPVALAAIDLKAVLTPTAKPPTPVFSLEARLADSSYIFSKNCHLTGGLAFYIWSNGDLVLSLGGYHPLFKVPAHYPSVDRLGITWVLSSHLFIKGGLYFAITPAAIMAGGSLEAQFHAGPIRAWFIAQADFLMLWKPFHYDIAIRIALGVSANLGLFRINLHIGVGLQLYGPPFGGVASVDLGIISFSIKFGSAVSAPPPLTWREFAAAFLPVSNPPHKEAATMSIQTAASVQISSARVGNGLIKKDKEFGAILNPSQFELYTKTAIPATSVQIEIEKGKFVDADLATLKTGLTGDWNQKIGIVPMHKTAKELKSVHQISIIRLDEGGAEEVYEYSTERLAFEGVWENAPKSLWSNLDLSKKEDQKTFKKIQLSGQSTLSGTLTGIKVKPKAEMPDRTLPIPTKSLQEELKSIQAYEGFSPKPDTIPIKAKPKNPQEALKLIYKALKKNRHSILEDLQGEGLVSRENINAEHFSDPAYEALNQSPIFID